VVPYGLEVADAPQPAGSRVLVRFDPELPAPPPENRPAPETGAHSTPRTWAGARLQVIDHFADGTVVHHCGDDPCTATNPGADP
jgi:hypothetical protein